MGTRVSNLTVDHSKPKLAGILKPPTQKDKEETATGGIDERTLTNESILSYYGTQDNALMNGLHERIDI